MKSCIQSWCNKHGIITSSLFEWKQTLISAVDKKKLALSQLNPKIFKIY